MPLAGELCTSSVGWPAVYYLHGLVSILLFTLFMLVNFKQKYFFKNIFFF